MDKNKYRFNFLLLLIFIVFSASYGYSENINKSSVKKKKVSKKTSTAAVKKSSKTPKETSKYVIKKGDTLRTIAKRKGITEKEILALNKHIRPTKLKPGQIILLPSSACVTSTLKATKYKKSFSVAADEIDKFKKVNELRAVDETEELDFDGDEEVAPDNLVLTEPGKGVYLYSLREDDLKKLISNALDYIGATYKYGGDNIASMDCSAFVRRVFKEININLPRTSREQYSLGVEIGINELKEGDLIFFAKKKRINHVGIYIGNNMYIHAARKGKGVIVSSLDSPYVKKYFVGAKRLFTIESAMNLSSDKLVN